MTKLMNAAGGYDFAGSRLQNLADGTSSSDAATKGQMDTAISTAVTSAVSNLDFKGSVRVASTANVSTSSAPSSIDGVTLSSGDRILLKDQTTGSQNGIYTFASAGSALTRATDADANAEVTPGLWVVVEEGTANADKAFFLTTNGPITVGTTSLTFAQYTVGSSSINKYSETGPSSGGTTWTITHSLGTKDVVVSVRTASGDEEVDVTVVHTDTNTVTITSTATMSSNSLRAVVIG